MHNALWNQASLLTVAHKEHFKCSRDPVCSFFCTFCTLVDEKETEQRNRTFCILASAECERSSSDNYLQSFCCSTDCNITSATTISVFQVALCCDLMSVFCQTALWYVQRKSYRPSTNTSSRIYTWSWFAVEQVGTSSKDFNMYSGSFHIESRPGHNVYRLNFFVVFLSSSMRVPQY
jgi:hypothetical protein